MQRHLDHSEYPYIPLSNIQTHTSYRNLLNKHILDPSVTNSHWTELAVATSSYISIPLPPLIRDSEDMETLRTNTCLQQHNMLIYYLTLGHRPSSSYYLHDPTDPSPPLVFVSSSPSWVECQARSYASSRLRVRTSSVVGI